MLSFFHTDDLDGTRMRNRFLVDATADDGIVDVGNRHQARSNRDLLAGQALRIAFTIPAFVVGINDFLGNFQETDLDPQPVFGFFEGFLAQQGVGFHDPVFINRQRTGLEQNHVGNTDLADVVQRCRAKQHRDVVLRQEGLETRVWA